MSSPANLQASPPATVSGRWLLKALAFALAAAALCCWAVLCLLFWQGSWQLLYHPSKAVTRTPASTSLAFDSVAFAASETGQTRLAGWWIAAAPNAPFNRFTVLYLHGQDGNLGGTTDELASLHAVGVNVLAFDYRGYGQSQFARPSEQHWRGDAEWSLAYLTATRQIAPGQIVLDGDGLGANLALEIAAEHPELAGVILRDPIPNPTSIIFNDARAHLVPAHLLVQDRYELNAPATMLRIPSLWFSMEGELAQSTESQSAKAFAAIVARKTLVHLKDSGDIRNTQAAAISSWLVDLAAGNQRK